MAQSPYFLLDTVRDTAPLERSSLCVGNMKKKQIQGPDLIELRKKAEDQLKDEIKGIDLYSREQIRDMVHELRTHQIELELQNEELRQAWEELAVSRDQYTDLYDRAPVGYLTVSRDGLIKKANLTAAKMLDTPRQLLAGQRFTDFIVSEDQDSYYRCRYTLLEKKISQGCEVRLKKKGGQFFWGRIENNLLEDVEDGFSIRIVISDISKNKQAELAIQRAHVELEAKVQERTHQLARMNAKLQDEIIEHHYVRQELEEYSERQNILNNLLSLSVQGFSLDEMLKRCIDEIVAFPGLGLEPSAVIFLKDKRSDNLVIRAHNKVPEELLQACASRSLGECLCGRAALSGEVVFASWQDVCHEVVYQGMAPHGHYCVPIVAADKNVLGVVTLFTQEGVERDAVIEGTLVAAVHVIATLVERTEAVESLAKRNELLSSIYDSVDSVALITTDLGKDDICITSFSPGAEKIFGYSRDEIINKPMSLLNIPEYEKVMPGALQYLQAGKKFYFSDAILTRKSGECFAATVSVSPLSNGSGKIIGALGVCVDVSDLKKIQAELQQANEELEKRVEARTVELQKTQQQVLHVEKLSAIGRLAASIAHEFNNPMQGVVTVLNGIAKRAPLEDEDMRLLQSALDECRRVNWLVRSLQDFNRPSSGLREPVDLQKSIDMLLLLSKNEYKKKKIEVVTDYGQNIPYVMVVSDQIKQVILNLLANAADACQNGGTIHISIRQEGDAVCIRIKDTGVGIPPENIDRIFEPFFTTKPEVKGTGLGLSISYGIIKEHKGTIEVESKPGKGTLFTVLLPVGNVKDEPDAA